jgi:hypothetical protein
VFAATLNHKKLSMCLCKRRIEPADELNFVIISSSKGEYNGLDPGSAGSQRSDGRPQGIKI